MLTTAQRRELHEAIVEYCETQGWRDGAGAAVRRDAGIGAHVDCGGGGGGEARGPGALERKWISVLRLQRRVNELEAAVKELTGAGGSARKEGGPTSLPTGSSAAITASWFPRGPPLKVCMAHRRGVHCVAMHPHFNLAVSGGEDATLRVWDLDTGRLEPPVMGHTAAVHDIAFHHGGALIATASSDTTVKVWDLLGSGAALLASSSGTPLSPGPAGLGVANMGSGGGKLPCLRTLVGHDHAVTGVAWVPDTTPGAPLRLCSASRDGTVTVWDVSSGRAVARGPVGHTDWVRKVVCFLAPGASGSTTSRSGAFASPAITPTTPSHATACAASVSSDHTVRVWGVPGLDVKAVGVGHSNVIECMDVMVGGGMCTLTLALTAKAAGASAVALATSRALDATPGYATPTKAGISSKQPSPSPSPPSTPATSATTPSTSTLAAPAASTCAYLATGSRDGTARVWAVNDCGGGGHVSLTCTTTLCDHVGWVKAVRFHPNGTWLFTLCEDKYIRVWDTVHGRLIRKVSRAGVGGDIDLTAPSSTSASPAGSSPALLHGDGGPTPNWTCMAVRPVTGPATPAMAGWSEAGEGRGHGASGMSPTSHRASVVHPHAPATMVKITALEVHDLRFPTNDPDYSAAYVVLKTDTAGLEGHGLTFTIGRGNDVVAAAIRALEHLVVGYELEQFTVHMGKFWHHITGDSQLRWIGPDKGAIHLATGAVVNAVWDLWGKQVGKPVWRIVADMTPAERVNLIDFKYVDDAITPEEALAIFTAAEVGKDDRIRELHSVGYPAYITSTGWIQYSADQVRKLTEEAVSTGLQYIKVKVGSSLESDIARLTAVREVIGPHRTLMVDANQKWGVKQAIDWMEKLAHFKPWWIEEPTSPDDILGHKAVRDALYPKHGICVATGEHCQNRIMFKQLIVSGAIDIVQIDSCRLGGVNEVLAVMLIAAKYGKPVCPHAGGVGLCEYVQHLAMIDYLCISGTKAGRVLEYVDHLHEHFLHPVTMKDGHYLPPTHAGYSITMHPHSIEAHTYPTGSVWVKELADRAAEAAMGATAGAGTTGPKTLRDW